MTVIDYQKMLLSSFAIYYPPGVVINQIEGAVLIVLPNICATQHLCHPSPQSLGLQNGVCHFCTLKIDQVRHEIGCKRSYCLANWSQTTNTYVLTSLGWIHRDKTRLQMPAKIFPHLKLKCQLFIGPTLGFDTKQRNSLFIKFVFFTIKTRF